MLVLLGVWCLHREPSCCLEPVGAASGAPVCASGTGNGRGACGGRLFSTGGRGAGRRTAVSLRGVLPAAVWGTAGCGFIGFQE